MSKKKRPRRKGKPESAISMSAMIDVVFLLLIFFIVTYAEPKVEPHLAINVPGNPTGKAPEHVPIDVEVHPDGLYFMSKPVSLAKLEDKLFSVMSNQKDTPIFVKMNPSAAEGQLISVLDLCGKVNLKNINIQTLKASNATLQ